MYSKSIMIIYQIQSLYIDWYRQMKEFLVMYA